MRSNAIILRILTAALFATTVCGCTSKIDAQVSTLAKARQCWLMKRARDYAFDLDAKCFGPCYGLVTVEVELNDVVSVAPDKGSESSGEDYLEDTPTIDELLDRILRYIEKSSQDGVELEVTYDQNHGYPRSIAYRNSNVSDLYYIATVDNVRMKRNASSEYYDCGL